MIPDVWFMTISWTVCALMIGFTLLCLRYTKKFEERMSAAESNEPDAVMLEAVESEAPVSSEASWRHARSRA